MKILKLHDGVYGSPWNHTLSKNWDMRWSNLINGTNSNEEYAEEENIWRKIIDFVTQNEVFGLGFSKTDIMTFLQQCPAPQRCRINIGPTVYLTEEEENVSEEQIQEAMKKPIIYNNEEDRDMNIEILFSKRQILLKSIPKNILTILNSDIEPGMYVIDICLAKRISLAKAKLILQQLDIEIVENE